MITFFTSILVLLLGYFFYSRIIERIHGIDPKRETPAFSMNDGVDYLPMPWWKIFMIQFLNIAGLGPIFGAVLGAMWGPVAFLWIVLGSVFAGAVHDYFSGMLSIKHKGLSITEIVGIYLGVGTKQFMRGFTVLLMIMVGVVFIMGPAKILAGLTPNLFSMTFLGMGSFYLLPAGNHASHRQNYWPRLPGFWRCPGFYGCRINYCPFCKRLSYS